MVFKYVFLRCPHNRICKPHFFFFFFNVLNQARSHWGFMKVKLPEVRRRPINTWRDSVTVQSTSEDFFEADSIKLKPKSSWTGTVRPRCWTACLTHLHLLVVNGGRAWFYPHFPRSEQGNPAQRTRRALARGPLSLDTTGVLPALLTLLSLWGNFLPDFQGGREPKTGLWWRRMFQTCPTPRVFQMVSRVSFSLRFLDTMFWILLFDPVAISKHRGGTAVKYHRVGGWNCCNFFLPSSEGWTSGMKVRQRVGRLWGHPCAYLPSPPPHPTPRLGVFKLPLLRRKTGLGPT